MKGKSEFNVTDAQGNLLCPSCGFVGYSNAPAYSSKGGMIGVTICPCCLWEPGFDDEPGACARAKDTIKESLNSYRSKWAILKEWQGKPELKPIGWNGELQLQELFETAPHLSCRSSDLI